MKGVIHYWSESIGYGIIKYKNNKAFVHLTNSIDKKFEIGDEVEFLLQDNIALQVQKTPTTPDIRPKANANTPGSLEL